MGSTALTAAVGTAAILLLPDGIAMMNEPLWQLRTSLRRAFLPAVDGLLDGPLFRLFAHCLRRCCCGRLASPCRAPHTLRAQAVGRSELVLWWMDQLGAHNPFHDEAYICAWCLAADCVPKLDSTSSAEKLAVWREVRPQESSLDDSEGSSHGDGRRHTALLEGLPAGASLRLRVCAVNRWGRSAWSKDEIQVDLPQQEQVTQWQAARGVGRSRVVTSGLLVCLQCRTPQQPESVLSYAELVCRPAVGDRDCPHGPFCSRCRSGISAQVLPSCVCRGLIDTWRE